MQEQRVRRNNIGKSVDKILGFRNTYINWLADGFQSSDNGRPCSTHDLFDSSGKPQSIETPIQLLAPVASITTLTQAAERSQDPRTAGDVHTLQAAGATADMNGLAFPRMSTGGYLNPSPQASPCARKKPASHVQPSETVPASSRKDHCSHHTALLNVSRRSSGPAGLCLAAPALRQLPALKSKHAGIQMPTRQIVPTQAAESAAPGPLRHDSDSTAVTRSCSTRLPCGSSIRGTPGCSSSFMPDAGAVIDTDESINQATNLTAPAHSKLTGEGASTSNQSARTSSEITARQGLPDDVSASADSGVACHRPSLSTSSEMSTVYESAGESFGGMSTNSSEDSFAGKPHTPTGLPGLSLSQDFKAGYCLNNSKKPIKHADLLHAMRDKVMQSALRNAHYRTALDAAISRARTSSASEVPGNFSQSGGGAKATGGAKALHMLTACDQGSVMAAVTTMASVSASVAAAVAARVAAAAVAQLESGQAAAKKQLTAMQPSGETACSFQRPTGAHAGAPPSAPNLVPALADQSVVLQLVPSAAPFLALQALRSKRVELIITHNAVFCAACEPCPADSNSSTSLRAGFKQFRKRVPGAKLALVADVKECCGIDVRSREKATLGDGDGKLQELAAHGCMPWLQLRSPRGCIRWPGSKMRIAC